MAKEKSVEERLTEIEETLGNLSKLCFSLLQLSKLDGDALGKVVDNQVDMARVINTLVCGKNKVKVDSKINKMVV